MESSLDKDAPSDLNAQKILIADDDEATRILLKVAISPWGYKVIEARDGEEAWDILQKPNPPQILILDWLMPKLDGVSLCKRINEKLDYHPYIIFLTRMTGTENVIQGLEAGADEFMLKPFDLSELRIRIYAGERIIKYRHQLAEQNKQLENYAINMKALAEEHAKQYLPLEALNKILHETSQIIDKVNQTLLVNEDDNAELIAKLKEDKWQINKIIDTLKGLQSDSPIVRSVAYTRQHKQALITPAADVITNHQKSIIDTERMREFFGDNIEAIQDFMKTFLSLASEHLEKIHQAIVKKDADQARYYFHLLGSAAGNTGIMKMYHLCGMGEKNIREANWEEVTQVYSDLETVLENIRHEIIN